MEVNLTFFILLFIFLLLMLFLDWFESKKYISSQYKQLAYRSVVITLLVLFFFGFKTNSFVIQEGINIDNTYNVDGQLISSIESPIYNVFPYSEELTYISLAFLMFYVSVIVDTIPRPFERGIRFYK